MAHSANAATYEIEWTGSTALSETDTSASWSFDLDADTLDAGDINVGDTINTAVLETSFVDYNEDNPQAQYYFRSYEFCDISVDTAL